MEINPVAHKSNSDGEISISRNTNGHNLIVSSSGYEPVVIERPWLQLLNPLGLIGLKNQTKIRDGRLEVPLKPTEVENNEE